VVYRDPAPAPPDRVIFTIEPTMVDITRAKTMLGYEPLVPRDRAMQLTLEWARSARLVPDAAAAPGRTGTS
jgi:nucleoside-diphosphate-sugar epimerase